MQIPRPVAAALCAIPWVAGVLSVAWLFVMRFPLSGIFYAETRLDGRSAWIQPFLPSTRTSPPGVQPDGWVGQRVNDDPVYFTARVPGPYERADVTIEYRSIRQPLIEFGVVRDSEGKDLELMPMYASALQNQSWVPATAGSMKGFVLQGTPSQKLADNDPDTLAVWYASSSMPLRMDPDGPTTETTLSLRGSHDIYVVPTEDFKAVFTMQAVNRQEGGDVATFRIFYGDEEISRDVVSISGSRDLSMGKAFEHDVSIPHARPGVYRISITASDDVFIRKMVTTSQKWVVGPRFVVGDVVGYQATSTPVTVWTNSRHIVADTFHPEGLQTVTFGNTDARLLKTHTPVAVNRTDSDTVAELHAQKGDIRLIGDGYFAFSPESFFEPKPRRLTDATDLQTEHINAVLTPYERPESLQDGWLRSTFHITVNPQLESLRFVLSAPGIASRGGAVDIRNIRIRYARQSLTISDWWLIIKRELVNAWRRL